MSADDERPAPHRDLLWEIFHAPDPASDEDRFLHAMYVAAGVAEDVPDLDPRDGVRTARPGTPPPIAGPHARLAAGLLEAGLDDFDADEMARIAVVVARGALGADDDEAVYAEALAIVTEVLAEVDGLG